MVLGWGWGWGFLIILFKYKNSQDGGSWWGIFPPQPALHVLIPATMDKGPTSPQGPQLGLIPANQGRGAPKPWGPLWGASGTPGMGNNIQSGSSQWPLGQECRGVPLGQPWGSCGAAVGQLWDSQAATRCKTERTTQGGDSPGEKGCGDKPPRGAHVGKKPRGNFTGEDTPQMLARSGHYP